MEAPIEHPIKVVPEIIQVKKSSPIPIYILIFIITAIIFSGITYFILTKKTTSIVNVPKPSTVTQLEKSDWLTYEDKQAGFSLQYPADVLLNGEGKGSTQMVLSVGSELIDQIKEAPMDSKEEAMKEKEALVKGELVGSSWASDVSLVNLGDVNGKVSITLAAFEECSVIISKSVTFYSNNYRVKIGLSGIKEQVIADNSTFFIDNSSCNAKAWDLKNQTTEKFVQAIKNKQLKGSGKIWSDTFDAILATVKIKQPKVIQQISASSLPQASISTGVCNFEDTSFCPILENIKAAMDTKNTQPIYSYLLPKSVTCDPDGMFVPICENAPKGTVKEGIMLGYVQSEGAVYPESQAISIVESYINSTNLIYHGVKQLGDKGTIVYLSQDKLKLLAFPFQKIDDKWKMNYLLMGTATDNYKNLDNTILGN